MQDTHLTVSGTVAAREACAGGFRITLDSLSFLPCGSRSFRNMVHSFNDRLRASDRMLVFLYGPGKTGTDLYGNSVSDRNPYISAEHEDQTDLFTCLRTGDRVTLRGKCAQPERATNPGQFDMRRYYHARNIYFTLRDVKIEDAARAKPGIETPMNLLRDALCELKYRMQRGLSEVFGREDASCLAAMLLGDRSGLDEKRRQIFQDGGIAYLLTVSALHVTLTGRTVYRLLRRFRRSFVCSALVSMGTVLMYVILTGGSISSQRACVMFFFWAAAQIPGRTEDRLTSLAGAALFILIRQPYALFDSSFQISCTCILSMELLPDALNRIISPGRAKQSVSSLWMKRVWDAAVLPLSIQAGTLPVFLYWYYQICPYTCLLHTVLLTAMSLLMGYGMGGAVCGLLLGVVSAGWAAAVFLAAGHLLAGPCHYLIAFFLLICNVLRELPGSVLILGRPHFIQIVAYYSILAAFLLIPGREDRSVIRKHPVKVRAAGLLTAVFMAGVITFRVRPRFRFTCLDIGQGSCNLIECGDYVSLFDAGSSSVDDVWRYRISPALKYYGIAEVDTVFLSHADLDHISGIGQMLEMYHRNLAGRNAGDVTIGQILLPDLPLRDERMEEILEAAKHWKIPVGYVAQGAFLKANELELNVLGPSADCITGNANEDCIVLEASCGGLRILMTGDLEKEGEELFIRRYRTEDSPFSTDTVQGEGGEQSMRVLVAGHHGSRYATSDEMLALTRPDLVLISCGRNNRYGHPAKEMLERLKKYRVPWKRTDLDGAVCIALQ